MPKGIAAIPCNRHCSNTLVPQYCRNAAIAARPHAHGSNPQCLAHEGRWQAAHYSQCAQNPTWHINVQLPRPCTLCSQPPSRGPLDDQAWQVLLGVVRVPTFAAAANAHARQAVPEQGGLRTIGNRTRLIRTPGALRLTVNGQHDRRKG